MLPKDTCCSCAMAWQPLRLYIMLGVEWHGTSPIRPCPFRPPVFFMTSKLSGDQCCHALNLFGPPFDL